MISDLAGFRAPGIVYPGPESISNILCRYKASEFDSIANGTVVTAWPDSSGQGHHLTLDPNGGGSNTITVARNALNGMTVLNKTGVFTPQSFGMYGPLTGIKLTSANTWALFCVLMCSAVNTESDIFGLGTSGAGNGTRFGLDTTPKWVLVYGNVGGWTGTLAAVFGRWYAVILVNDADTETLYVNGAALTWSSQPGTRGGVVDQLQVFEGYTGASGYGFQGQMAEFAFFNYAPNAADRDVLWRYVRNRYGITF